MHKILLNTKQKQQQQTLKLLVHATMTLVTHTYHLMFLD